MFSYLILIIRNKTFNNKIICKYYKVTKNKRISIEKYYILDAINRYTLQR